MFLRSTNLKKKTHGKNPIHQQNQSINVDTLQPQKFSLAKLRVQWANEFKLHFLPGFEANMGKMPSRAEGWLPYLFFFNSQFLSGWKTGKLLVFFPHYHRMCAAFIGACVAPQNLSPVPWIPDLRSFVSLCKSGLSLGALQAKESPYSPILYLRSCNHHKGAVSFLF